MRFFIDNCISKKIAKAFALLVEGEDQNIVHLTDRFAADVPDADWIRALAAEGDWIIISADPRIVRNRIEQEAWRESGLTAFFLVDFSRMSVWKQVAALSGYWPTIVRFARECPPGSGFLIKPKQKEFERIFGSSSGD